MKRGDQSESDEAFGERINGCITHFLRAQYRDDFLRLWENDPMDLVRLAQVGASAVMALLDWNLPTRLARPVRCARALSKPSTA